MRFVVIALFSLYSLSINAQSFGVSDTLKILSKTTDFGVLHDFIQLENFSGKDLAMRWKQTISPGFPSAWIPSIQDPDNWYNHCDTVDSADFVLPDSTTFSDKMVIGLDHQQMVGAGFIYYQLFPIDDPTDTINIAFSLNVSEGTGTTGLDKLSATTLEIYPNPASDEIRIIKPTELGIDFSIRLIDANGKVHGANYQNHKDYLLLERKDLASGIYMIQMMAGNALWQQKIVFE